ncbi:DUF3311 domain-containing protein [Kitasatospora sp. NPDC096147]|uniref:DUF3311 domain-containing protein n=1 Tax=Kitasatospora sp. NPDC096147 TaxID=3364093 RepID=UPI00380E3AF7
MPGARQLPAVTPARVIAGICLLLPVVAMLWVSSYAKATPELGGMPFFYWYQLAWVPLSAVFTVGAYLLLRRDEQARRAASVPAPRKDASA